jgi:NhaP-type Na+/H+ or K+/H+ antiporter
VFVTAGYVYSETLGLLQLDPEHELVKLVAEITLVWVLFSDAAKVDPQAVRSDLGWYVRLLGVGLPLTIALGTLVAVLVLDVDPWPALLVGAALAPTDAALGAAVMSNPLVPAKIRRILNVESGLNDGIATPVVVLAIAGIATEAGIEGVHGPGHVLVSLLVGVLVGAVVGGLGGRLTRTARGHGWMSQAMAGPAVLALALLAYAAAIAVDGNGFVAAFIGGVAFGRTAGPREEREVAYVEETGGLASEIAWLLFGALAVPVLLDVPDWAPAIYALLSLTVIRMLPVALCLIGSGSTFPEMAFVGWFGPRGLASVIFALLALEDLSGRADTLVATICLTVVFSIVAHGLTAGPLARRFAEEERASG